MAKQKPPKYATLVYTSFVYTSQHTAHIIGTIAYYWLCMLQTQVFVRKLPPNLNLLVKVTILILKTIQKFQVIESLVLF